MLQPVTTDIGSYVGVMKQALTAVVIMVLLLDIMQQMMDGILRIKTID